MNQSNNFDKKPKTAGGDAPEAMRRRAMRTDTDRVMSEASAKPSDTPVRVRRNPTPQETIKRPAPKSESAAPSDGTRLMNVARPNAQRKLEAQKTQAPRRAPASPEARPKTLSRHSERVALAKRGKKKSFFDTLREKNSTSPIISSAIKAIIYIAAVFVVAGVLSYFGITIGNDIFAFVKSPAEVNVTIPEYASLDDIADILKDNNVIRYPSMFKLYANIRKYKLVFEAGDYTVTPSMNYDSLLVAFKEKAKERTEVRVTIPEGYNVDDIIDLMVNEYEIGTRDGYVDVIQNYDFDFWFVDELTDLPEGRKYRLEGYLYPDTYYFFSDSSEEAIIYKMLSNFNNKFTDEYREKCADLHMTVDQVITLASMVQMEAKYDTEFADISSVFHNRLNHPNVTNGKLESDATIQYALDERKESLTYADTELDNPYNTYMYKGLPPSAISNPTIVVINYALYPSNTSYYFFVAQDNGYTLFAKTLSEHNANKQEVANSRK